MARKGQPRQGNYAPAQYLYFGTKHPHEWKVCETCGQEGWIQKRRRFCSYACSKTGRENPQWKGDGASYGSLHARVYRAKGRAFGCEKCGSSDPDGYYEWANLTGHYEDVNDYASMCASCHRQFDAKPRVYTAELLDRAAAMVASGMTRKAVAAELAVAYTNLTQRLRQRDLGV